MTENILQLDGVRATIRRMDTTDFYPRLVRDRLDEAWRTLRSSWSMDRGSAGNRRSSRARGGRRYVTLDDAATLTAVRADPSGFVLDLDGPVTIDEVQRVPELFLAIKLSVDRDRRPGRFLLTGSANPLFVPEVADSLAGRMAIVRLHPLSESRSVGKRRASSTALSLVSSESRTESVWDRSLRI